MDWFASVLLRRLDAVTLPPRHDPQRDDGWVRALETDLLQRGWLMSPELRDAFAELGDPARLLWSDWLLSEADRSVGADRLHTPLFRSFPDVPDSLDSLFVDVLLTQLLQRPQAPCVLCGSPDSVSALNPCGHLVCGLCLPPDVFSGCPVCGRRTASGQTPFLELGSPDSREESQPLRWTRLGLIEDPDAAASRVRDELVTRPRPLSEEEANDLALLTLATVPGSLDWLPETIPAKENLARALATALATSRPDVAPSLKPQLTDGWQTATDIARTVWTYSGGTPDLTLPTKLDAKNRPPGERMIAEETVRVRALPRWLRRAILDRIDSFDLPTAAEDLARHETVWKRIAERLHPFESVTAHPRAAVCFAALRGTLTDSDSPLGRAMVNAAKAHPGRVRVIQHSDGRISVRVHSHASLVERALQQDDPATALSLLSSRPGELWRRVDQLARAVGNDPTLRSSLLDAARATASRVSPGVLATASNHLSQRAQTVKASEAVLARDRQARSSQIASEEFGSGHFRGEPQWGSLSTRQRQRTPAPGPDTPRRIFFPSGDTVRTWARAEHRDPLDQELASALSWAGLAELVRRAERLPDFDVVVVDARTANIPAPTRTQASSEQLAGWARGARFPLPDHDGVLRLFLHWTDSDFTRVDLDLSCTLLDTNWQQVGFCDYTQLRWGDAVKHSGDLTSAPAPAGATEYIDLDLPALEQAGVRWIVPVVFSYNDVPFEHLDDAFAGFMLPQAGASAFQPDRVVQRFDLRGRSRISMPMVVDLAHQSLLWTDTHLAAHGYGHSVAGNRSSLARLAADMWEHFGNQRRFSVFDLVAVHAIGRASHLRVVHSDGTHSDVDLDAPPNEAWQRIRGALEQRRSSGVLPEIAGSALVALVNDTELPRVLGTLRVDETFVLTAASGSEDGFTVHDLIGELEATHRRGTAPSDPPAD